MDDLSNLAGLAAEADAGAAPGAPGPEAVAPEPTRNDQAADLVNMFAGMVTSYVPETASVFTAESNARCAMAIAPVLEKYNFSMEAIPCELVAAFIVGPVLFKAGKIVVEKLEMERAHAAGPASPAARAAATSGAEDMPFQPPAPAADVAPAAGLHPQMALYKHG